MNLPLFCEKTARFWFAMFEMTKRCSLGMADFSVGSFMLTHSSLSVNRMSDLPVADLNNKESAYIHAPILFVERAHGNNE